MHMRGQRFFAGGPHGGAPLKSWHEGMAQHWGKHCGKDFYKQYGRDWSKHCKTHPAQAAGRPGFHRYREQATASTGTADASCSASASAGVQQQPPPYEGKADVKVETMEDGDTKIDVDLTNVYAQVRSALGEAAKMFQSAAGGEYQAGDPTSAPKKAETASASASANEDVEMSEVIYSRIKLFCVCVGGGMVYKPFPGLHYPWGMLNNCVLAFFQCDF